MKDSRDKISVIMPAYNAARYIMVAVSSVRAQTWENWELIIVDDHSSDCTLEILLAMADPRIVVLHNLQNLGVAESRNKGVEHASGEWIAFLDSDDRWDSKKLEKQLACAHEKQAEFIFTGSAFMNERGELLDSYLAAPERVGYRELLKQNVVSCSSVMIKKWLLLEYPMQQAEQMHEDFAVWLQILRDRNIDAYGVDEPLLIYRVSTSSKSGNKCKAAMMTFRVYRSIGLAWPEALYYWMFYVVRSLRKYQGLCG